MYGDPLLKHSDFPMFFVKRVRHVSRSRAPLLRAARFVDSFSKRQINQTSYAKKVIAQANMEICHPVASPMDKGNGLVGVLDDMYPGGGTPVVAVEMVVGATVLGCICYSI